MGIFGIRYVLAIATAGGLAFVVGAWPAWALARGSGLIALAVGVGIAWLGAVLGHLPLLFFRRSEDAVLNAALAGVGIRLLSTLAMAVVALFSLPFPREPLAIGLVLAYLSLLAMEVRGLVSLSRASVAGPRAGPPEKADGT